jgi:hypothetical protein
LSLDPGGLKVILTDLEVPLIAHMDDEGKLEEKRVFAKREVGPTFLKTADIVTAYYPTTLI